VSGRESLAGEPGLREPGAIRDRSVRQDNYAGAHPAALEALAEANAGWAPSYGDDVYTLALGERMRELFGDVEAFPVFNGTGGNVTALGTVLRPHEAVICPQTAHINVDECGARTLRGLQARGLPRRRQAHAGLVRGAVGVGDQHHVQARVSSASRPSWARSTRPLRPRRWRPSRTRTACCCTSTARG
jgi:threonine aldolase